MALKVGDDAVVYLGNLQVNEIKLNGKVLEKEYYTVENKILTIDASVLQEGENTLNLTDEVSLKINVSALPIVQPETEEKGWGCNSSVSVSMVGVLVLSLVAVALIRRKQDGCND